MNALSALTAERNKLPFFLILKFDMEFHLEEENHLKAQRVVLAQSLSTT